MQSAPPVSFPPVHTVKGKVLISVSDKGGLPELAAGLVELGYELVSTGGSAAAIEKAGLPVTKVEQLTNFPEMLDGMFFISAHVSTWQP